MALTPQGLTSQAVACGPERLIKSSMSQITLGSLSRIARRRRTHRPGSGLDSLCSQRPRDSPGAGSQPFLGGEGEGEEDAKVNDLHEFIHLGRDAFSAMVSRVPKGKELNQLIWQVSSSSPTCFYNNS